MRFNNYDFEKSRNIRGPGYQIENFVGDFDDQSNTDLEWLIIGVTCFLLISLVVFGSALKFWRRREKNKTEKFRHYIARDGLLDLERISEEIQVEVARDENNFGMMNLKRQDCFVNVPQNPRHFYHFSDLNKIMNYDSEMGYALNA